LCISIFNYYFFFYLREFGDYNKKNDIDLKEYVELAQYNISTLENLMEIIDKEFKLMFKEAKENILLN
jgi:hypothetical protein